MAISQNGRKITISAGQQTLKFVVTLADFHSYQNELTQDNKISPSRNFLTRTVDPASLSSLETLISDGFTLDLAALVASEFRPDLELSVKK